MLDVITIIPTCRRPELLRQAIESALSQEGVRRAVLVVDDDPAGSAAAVAARYPVVRYHRNPSPTGGWPGLARNEGLAAARRRGLAARWIHFLDDDDLALPGFYSSALAVGEGVGVVFGAMVPFCDPAPEPELRRGQEARLAAAQRWRGRARRIARLCQKAGPWLFRLQAAFGPELFLTSAALIRSEAVEALGGFDPRFRVMEDYELFGRAIRRFGVRFLDQPVARYRLGSPEALWSPAEPRDEAAEIRRLLHLRQADLAREAGPARTLAGKIAYRLLLQPALYA